MSKLVGKREHPRRFGIGAVHENKWRIVIAQHEAPEFLGIEGPVVVESNDGARRYQDAETFSRIAKSAESFFPGSVNFGPLRVKAELLAHACGQGYDVVRLWTAGDEVQRLLSLFDQ